ncbi:MAG: hypothetical protein ABSF50_22920, partial [Burkholderiaceae bacterium]
LDRSSNLWHNAAPLVGAVLLACTYLSAPVENKASVARQSLSRLGALALIPACIMLGEATDAWLLRPPMKSPALGAADALAWIIAIGLPFGLALALRGGRAIYLLAVLVWCLVTVQFHWGGGFNDAGLYGSFALGAMGLAVWGVREQRQEIVNLGVLSFALTTLAFYFSSVMDKLERSLSLFLGGLLFLQGGWCLEGIRRRLISSIRQGNS